MFQRFVAINVSYRAKARIPVAEIRAATGILAFSKVKAAQCAVFTIGFLKRFAKSDIKL